MYSIDGSAPYVMPENIFSNEKRLTEGSTNDNNTSPGTNTLKPQANISSELIRLAISLNEVGVPISVRRSNLSTNSKNERSSNKEKIQPLLKESVVSLRNVDGFRQKKSKHNPSQVLYKFWESNNNHFPLWVYNLSTDPNYRKSLDYLDNAFRKAVSAKGKYNGISVTNKKEDIHDFLKPIRTTFASRYTTEGVLLCPDQPYELKFSRVSYFPEKSFHPIHSTSTKSYVDSQIDDFISIIRQITDMGITIDEMEKLSKNVGNSHLVSELDAREHLPNFKPPENAWNDIDVSKEISHLSSLLDPNVNEETSKRLKSLFNDINFLQYSFLSQNKPSDEISYLLVIYFILKCNI